MGSVWVFAGRGHAVLNRLVALVLAFASLGAPSLLSQNASRQEPADLKVELRTISGANRFQLGEVIPIEVLISSTSQNRYLEPCKMFWESCFGYPQCRFETHWSLDVSPSTGWTDIGAHGCMTMSGPSVEVKSPDLTMEPKKYPYTLTSRFRFDTPGRYTVRLSMTVGLDDETNQISTRDQDAAQRHFVSKTAELTLEILPGTEAWKNSVLERGITAWSTAPPPYTNPPSPALVQYQQDKDAFCNLGTAQAAVAFVDLLSRDIDTRHCLRINANKEAAMAEMQRLLVAPDVGVRGVYFAEYAAMRSPRGNESDPTTAVAPASVRALRDTLIASLPEKAPEAMISSLETVLRNPLGGYWVMAGSPYDLREPYSEEVIAMTAANYDRLSPATQAALMDREWIHVRSPLMLPVVRREAEKGRGDALLRWQELDPDAAIAFMRNEVLRPSPRFSALYIRLPEKSLTAQQQQQMARNFVLLNAPQEVIAEATLLHRYATRAVLETVLPFIDQHLAQWPCKVQVPVLAFLLKVSPADATIRLDQLVKTVQPPYCPKGSFLSSIGYMQPDPALERVAAAELARGTPLAGDAAVYLMKYGSPAMKPVVWEQLTRWHKRYVESGARARMESGTLSQDDSQLYMLDTRLQDAYSRAQGWTLSTEDVHRLSDLLGVKAVESLVCTFSCGGSLGVAPPPANYWIYGRLQDPVYTSEDRIEYLMPMEPYRYRVHQYSCPDLQSLKAKLLQYPPGSKFSFANTGTGEDVGDWESIRTFLQDHRYVVGN